MNNLLDFSRYCKQQVASLVAQEVCEIFFSNWWLDSWQSVGIWWPMERNGLATPTGYSANQLLSSWTERKVVALSSRRRSFNAGSKAHYSRPKWPRSSGYRSSRAKTLDQCWAGNRSTGCSRSHLPTIKYPVGSSVARRFETNESGNQGTYSLQSVS